MNVSFLSVSVQLLSPFKDGGSFSDVATRQNYKITMFYVGHLIPMATIITILGQVF